jgi:type II secretory pathway component PulC
MMAQWRNVGLRDRAQLLQQAWLTADYAASPDAKQTMTGLRVRKLIKGSFWQQLGLEEGDLLQEINGLPVNSMDAWQQVIQIAQNDTEITITVERDARKHSYRTETIRPR